MLFSSLVFLFIFLPLSIICYYISPKKFRNGILLIFSLFFYGYGEPKYLKIMILSIFINYIMGLFADRYREQKLMVKVILFLAIAMNLSIIGYYKYTNFFIENINQIFGWSMEIKKIIMPIGISFFTFQGLSYVIDVYRQDGEVQKNPFNVALYVSLFPQLIAGPIVRYETVVEEINYRKENINDFVYGIERFILGLGKKVIIANTIGFIADEIFKINTGDLSVLLAWIGILSYTGQIYFDFSGYSDMAIGLGKMFGFTFLENFKYPYISKSITEFWRRWHISLSTWFRDYVYIPMGGNRVSKFKFLRNIFVVWFLTGLWHGASWNFIIWGLYYGSILVLEKLVFGKYLSKMKSPFQHLYTMILVVFGWLIFRAENLGYAKDYLQAMLGMGNIEIISKQAMFYIIEYRYLFILAIVASTPIYPFINNKLEKIKNPILNILILDYIKPILLIGIFILSIMYLVNSTFNPFIYFRF